MTLSAIPPIIFLLAAALAVEAIAYSLARYLPGLLASLEIDR